MSESKPTFGPELREPDGDGWYWFEGAISDPAGDNTTYSGAVMIHREYVSLVHEVIAWSQFELSGRWWRIVPPTEGE